MYYIHLLYKLLIHCNINGYALDSLKTDIVVEQFKIEDYDSNEPMLHFAYFDVSKDISVNQWIDLGVVQHGDTTVYYTAAPNPGFWNISVFTCTGKCNTPCHVIKDPNTKEKSCLSCSDNTDGHKCEGNTESVDVISYVFDQIGKLSPFAPLLG